MPKDKGKKIEHNIKKGKLEDLSLKKDITDRSKFANSKTVDNRHLQEYIIRNANLGFLEAQKVAADLYYKGEIFEKDINKAVYWLHHAAIQGDAESKYTLGLCYENGEGVERDKEKAIDLFMEAATLNHEGAWEKILSEGQENQTQIGMNGLAGNFVYCKINNTNNNLTSNSQLDDVAKDFARLTVNNTPNYYMQSETTRRTQQNMLKVSK